MYSDVQISKNGLQLKLKLHQLWRIAMWLSHDCLWILTASCFSGDNVSLWTGVRSSSLGDNFWKSLTALWLFCYSHFVIRQDHGFGSPRKTLISCRVGFLLSCFYKSNSSYLFCAVIFSALVTCISGILFCSKSALGFLQSIIHWAKNCMHLPWDLSPVRAHSLWAGLCPEKLLNII